MARFEIRISQTGERQLRNAPEPRVHDKSLVSGPNATHRRVIVGDALVASRPRKRRRWQPDADDHKGRPYEAFTLAATEPPKICRTPPNRQL